MNALAIKTENLPETPEKLAEISVIGGEFVDACIQKIRRIDKLGDAYNEKTKLLKEGQRVAILLFEVDKKIAELSKTIKSKAYEREVTERNEKGQILSTRAIESGGQKKWELLGLESQHQLKTAQYINKHPNIVEFVIDKAIKSGSIPRRQSVMSEIRKRRKNKVDEKENMIKQLNKIHTKIMNYTIEKDDYFLNKSKKILENILKKINDTQDIDSFLVNGPNSTEEKVIKRLL